MLKIFNSFVCENILTKMGEKKQLPKGLRITSQQLVAELAGCSVGLVSMVWKGERENGLVIEASWFVSRKIEELKKEWEESRLKK
jgi:hypothetical protein